MAGDRPRHGTNHGRTRYLEGLYEEAIPSVVSIYVTPAEGADPRRVGAGSGFVYDRAGHVVTNQHVVGGATLGEHPRASAVDRSRSPRRNGRRIPIE